MTAIERRCPCCGQYSHVREGVQLSPLKARIFDLVRRSGDEGIDADEIARIVFDGRAARNTIKVHICQINELLISTDLRIVGTRGGSHRHGWAWPYRLVRSRNR